MDSKNIRNIALLGHGNSGKTSLTESMLFVTGAIDRQGKVSRHLRRPEDQRSGLPGLL